MIADKDVDPSQAIVEVARSWCPDMVMLPTSDSGSSGDTFWDRPRQRRCTICNARCGPAFMRNPRQALEDIHCRRILCSVDLSVCSRSVLQWTDWLARQYRADLGIVHANPAVEASVASLNIQEEFDRQVSAHAKKRIDALQAEAGTTAQVFMNPGRPEVVVAQTAAGFNADLVVIGRHGGEGISGNVFYSAYAILREAPRLVISV